MRIKQESSIIKALHPDDELYRASARIVTKQTFIDMDNKMKAAIANIVCEKKRQILQDNLARNGIDIN